MLAHYLEIFGRREHRIVVLAKASHIRKEGLDDDRPGF